MDELEIKIVLTYKVPENGLTLNAILRGLQEDQNTLMRNIVRAILAALEKKVVEEYISNCPDKYSRYGRQPRERKLRTSFGPVSYRLAQLYDRQTKKVFAPLVKKLSILSHKQYQREALEAGVGQVIHLSYRVAEKEVRRIKGEAPGKSTLHRYIKELAEEYGQWPSFKHREFKFLMVDGTRVKRQGPRGQPLESAEMRWALASEGARGRFEPVGFWVDKDWKFIRQDLEKRLDYGKLIKALTPEKYPKARTYIENFARNAVVVFDYWLEGKGWIPLTTNAIESAFSQIVNRVKRVGRRWSDEGLVNWLMIAFRKIYKPALWDELWTKYLKIHKPLRFFKLRVSYAWI